MKISIAMCTYNGGEYVDAQLESFLQQSRLPDELVICDDHSSDRTWEIATSFARSAPFPVMIERNENNLGVTANFEKALQMTSGDVIFLSDQDDVWPKEKVLEICAAFEADESLGMVFTDAAVVDQALRPLGKNLWEAVGFTMTERGEFTRDPFKFLLTNRNVVTGAAAAFSRNVVCASLPFPQNMVILHDAWLALIAAHISSVKADPERLLNYRQHAAQVTGVARARPDFGKKHYLSQLEQMVELRNRINQYPGHNQGRDIELTRGYIDHLQSRTQLSSSIAGRIGAVGKEFVTGRYGRYSSGVRSALKDLLRG